MPVASFALILGVIAYLFGLPLLFAERDAVAWRKKFLKDDVSIRIIGGAIVVLAALTLKTKWDVSADAEGLVVFLAWLTLIKGLFVTWWPAHYAQLLQWEDKHFDAPAWQMLFGLLVILFGALLTYLGLALQLL